MTAERVVGDRAVVLGGSMAGLLAARVLADSYGEVVVVDRDGLTGTTSARRGVPQGRHVHGLLARGQQVLDELFPGFTEEAVADGIPTGDLGELRWFFHGRRLRPAPTGLVCVSATRPRLEALVRNRVAALPNVRFLERRSVDGLIATPDRRAVTGVRVRGEGPDAAVEELTADLVVDATGRGSRTPVWLSELGYARPEEDRIRIDLSYTTRIYRPREGRALVDDLSINPVSSPSHPRGAFLSRIEDGCYVLSLTGVFGDAAPTDPDGFLDWVRSLPVPDIHEVIRDAEPLGDPVQFRYPHSVRRRYERLTAFPDRLLVMGDALCSFNPVYGQGMTAAALEAVELREHLRAGAPRPLEFLRAVARVIDVPWDMSAGGDLAYPQVTGRRSLKVRVGNAYMAKVQAAATGDGAITRAFMRVAGLVDPPGSMMRPGMVLRVLRAARKVGRSRPVDGPVVAAGGARAE
ncbi:FAD-dependent oxidoreductase [Saccharothrix obliqua]|uniref:FAD-dependent oxidoreductase n=1 Tax=Saccharothrix obliqua TaxID=2861747 RepID=UPI001C5F5BF7|nr:FAD-dependent oxidoreductase [Saccharothrix obliqua]MBW4721824.1 FAD-binding monooxygenase [Saccharothrix obliqua]